MQSTVGQALVVIIFIATLPHTSTAPKSFLSEYEAIPHREVDGMVPSLEINGTDAETCARKCSTERTFPCLHFQYRLDTVNPPGICQIFSLKGRAYTEISDTWTIYTKNRAAFAGIPEGGASALIGGSHSLSTLLMIFSGAVAAFLVT